jgi:hypothetical protein
VAQIVELYAPAHAPYLHLDRRVADFALQHYLQQLLEKNSHAFDRLLATCTQAELIDQHFHFSADEVPSIDHYQDFLVLRLECLPEHVHDWPVQGLQRSHRP